MTSACCTDSAENFELQIFLALLTVWFCFIDRHWKRLMNILRVMCQNLKLFQHNCFLLVHLRFSPVGRTSQCEMFVNGSMCVCISSIKITWLKWKCQKSRCMCKLPFAACFPLSHPLSGLLLSLFWLLSPNVHKVRPQLSGWSHLLNWVLVSLILD